MNRADLRVAKAEEALAAADREYRASRDALAGLRRAIDEAEALGRLTEEDRNLVADADARGLPDRHAQLQELLDRQSNADELRGSLETEHRGLVDRARSMRADAEAEIVREARVVATTLARSRLHSALAGATFDVVLVDEAGDAALAEVLLALCRATTTAVLFGDFRRPGPVLGDAVQDDPSPAVRRWVRATCFSHVGIESPADVGDGCVALTHQVRPAEVREHGPERPAELGRDETREPVADPQPSGSRTP